MIQFCNSKWFVFFMMRLNHSPFRVNNWKEHWHIHFCTLCMANKEDPKQYMLPCITALSFVVALHIKPGWTHSRDCALLGKERLLGAHYRPYKERSLTGTLPVQFRHLNTPTTLLGSMTQESLQDKRQNISVALLQDKHVQGTEWISPIDLCRVHLTNITT